MTGVGSSKKGGHQDEPEALQGHTSEPLSGPGEGAEKRMIERSQFRQPSSRSSLCPVFERLFKLLFEISSVQFWSKRINPKGFFKEKMNDFEKNKRYEAPRQRSLLQVFTRCSLVFRK